MEDRSVIPQDFHEVYLMCKELDNPLIPPHIVQNLKHTIVGPGVLITGLSLTDEAAKAIERAINIAFSQGYITAKLENDET